MPTVRTPIGVLQFECRIDERVITADVPAYFETARARHFAWTSGDIRAELVLTSPPPGVPSGALVARLDVALWRVSTTTPTSRCEFACRWASGQPPAAGSPETGQFLAAASWETSEWKVTVGAPDSEAIAAQRSLPRAWRALLDVPDPIEVAVEAFEPDALLLTLPGLAPGDVGQVHFAVAVSRPDDGSAGWIAVDISPDTVMRYVNATDSSA